MHVCITSVAIDYFSRWIEAESFSTLKAKQMAKFIEKSLICRYGVPHHIVIDNGVQFQAETMSYYGDMVLSIISPRLIDLRLMEQLK